MMRSEEEIRERLQALRNKRNEILNGDYLIPDWNTKQFETAIWYLEWVLNENKSDSTKQINKCENCIYNAQREDMIKKRMIGIPYPCLHCGKEAVYISLEKVRNNDR